MKLSLMETIFHGAQASSRVSETLTQFSECFLGKSFDQLPRNCSFSVFAIPYSSMRADCGWQHSHSEAVGQQVNVLARDPECASLGSTAAWARTQPQTIIVTNTPLHQGRHYTQISPASLNTCCSLSAEFQHLHAVLALCLGILNF